VDGLELRPVGRGDDELLLRIYASTRSHELAALPWDDAAKEAFLRAQLAAQAASYERYPGRSHQVVLLGGEPVGRLYLARTEQELLILDVSLLPEHRGRGIGTALLRAVLDEAAAAGKRVRLHVERSNRALRLYRRLGFREVADLGVYLQLDWAPYVKTAS
jgi:ribosomal protein S18 acetylase RimI-like enzyme